MLDTGLLNIRQAAEYLNLSQSTLRKWERLGKINPLKTAGGHRRYQIEDLDKLVGKTNTGREIVCPHCGETIIIT